MFSHRGLTIINYQDKQIIVSGTSQLLSFISFNLQSKLWMLLGDVRTLRTWVNSLFQLPLGPKSLVNEGANQVGNNETLIKQTEKQWGIDVYS